MGNSSIHFTNNTKWSTRGLGKTVKKKAPETTDPSLASGKKKQGMQSDKVSRLFVYIEEIRKEGLTGHIKVNFNQGNICKIEKHEEILRD